MLQIALSLLMLTVAATAVRAADSAEQASAPVTAAQVRSSIESALPFLEKRGTSWFDNAKCIACHHGEWLTWSMNEAKHAGIAIDGKVYDELTSRVVGIYMGATKQKTDHVQSSYMLLSQYDPPVLNKDTPEWMKTAIAHVEKAQLADGSWKYAGQGLDRPDQENDEMQTMWAMLALPVDAKAAREKGMAWLKTVKQGPSIDSVALRLALEARFGDAANVPALRDELISRQNEDGGWSWKPTRKSEAFATGESLYVLSLAGVSSDSSAVQKSLHFLVSTQKADGSWMSPTRKPKGENVVSSYWGTNWAVIGMARTLPVPVKPAKGTAQTSAR